MEISVKYLIQYNTNNNYFYFKTFQVELKFYEVELKTDRDTVLRIRFEREATKFMSKRDEREMKNWQIKYRWK